MLAAAVGKVEIFSSFTVVITPGYINNLAAEE